MKNCLLRSFQALLVFSLAFTLTNCGNLDNPLEELSGGGSGGSGDGGGSSTINATDIKLDQTMKVIKMGGSATITATPVPSDATITWESSDAAVATVSNGVVTPVAVGFATITAKSGDVKATCKIFVGNEVALASSNYTVQNYDILKGDLLSGKSITIPDGVNVAFDGITTDQTVTCEGDATIYLTDGSENTVDVSATFFNAGIKVGPTGKTLTIEAETAGTGKLNATGGDGAAGIGTGEANTSANTCGAITINGGKVTATGGGRAAGIGTGCAENSANTCGAITINGGTVTASGGSGAAGIGTGKAYHSANTCGAITINGGTVTATGGYKAAGIGTGNAENGNKCGAITITTGVTSVTATKGTDSPNSIGEGYDEGSQTCGTITIGGVVKNQSDFTGDTYTYPAP